MSVASTSTTTPVKRPIEVIEDDSLSDIVSRSPSPDIQFDKSNQTSQVDINGNADWGPITTCDWDACGITFGDQHVMLDHIYTGMDLEFCMLYCSHNDRSRRREG